MNIVLTIIALFFIFPLALYSSQIKAGIILVVYFISR